MQTVFFNIIGEQIKSKMLAEASPEFAFITVSPAMVPEERSRPNRTILCIFITLVGGMLSIMWLFVLRLFHNVTASLKSSS